MQFENRTDTLGKHGRLIEVSDTHAAARDLVFIGRTDAAARSADFLRPESRFTRVIERNMVRHDERAVTRDMQAGFGIHAVAL